MIEKRISDCINLLKVQYRYIYHCDFIEHVEDTGVFILLCKNRIDNIQGIEKYLLIKANHLTLEELSKLIKFYENFILDKCNGKYRMAQLVLCSPEELNFSIKFHIDIYNKSFKDTRPAIVYLKA